MYFVPDKRGIWAIIVRTPPSARWVFSFALLTSLCLLWYLFVYRSFIAQEQTILRSIAAGRQEKEHSQFQLAELQQKNNQQSAHLAQLREGLKSYGSAILIPEKTAVEIISQLPQYELQLESFAPQVVQEKESLRKHQYTISCTGRFASFLSWCSDLQKKYHVHCTGIMLKKREHGAVHCTCNLIFPELKEAVHEKNSFPVA